MFFAGRISANIESTTQQIKNNMPFRNGEIIYPDYAHGDTLIVKDADGLNKELLALSDNKDWGSDSDIDNVLNKYTVNYADVCTPDKLCPNALQAIKRLRDYQLDVYEDSTVVYDGDRHVATLRFDSTQALDSTIMDDNQ